MKVKWEDGFDHVSAIEQLFSLGASPTRYDANCARVFAVLTSMVQFSEKLTWEKKFDLAEAGAIAAVNANAREPAKFLSHITNAAKAYASMPKQKYVLYTSINLPRDADVPRWKTGGVTVSFPKTFPKKLKPVRDSLFEEYPELFRVTSEPQMKVVRAAVVARNADEASTACLAALDLLRGYWNFFKTKSSRISIMGAKRPVNVVFIGPLHTMHGSDGALLEKKFWYDSEFNPNVQLADLHEKDSALLKAVKKVERKLDSHPYAEKLQDAFTRYARALDTVDFDQAILKLWSLLELLTGTGFSGYEPTIRRAAFLYKDNVWAKQSLEHLRRYRNRSVHAGVRGEDLETEVYLLKSYVDELFRFHIRNHFKFQTLEEACALLDLPPSEEPLRARLTIVQQAMKYRRVPLKAKSVKASPPSAAVPPAGS